MVLDKFHPAVASWFHNSFDGPTEIQEKAWPEIKKKSHTLISVPTGSGKTSAVFLASIDDLLRQSLESGLPDNTQVCLLYPYAAADDLPCVDLCCLRIIK